MNEGSFLPGLSVEPAVFTEVRSNYILMTLRYLSIRAVGGKCALICIVEF